MTPTESLVISGRDLEVIDAEPTAGALARARDALAAARPIAIIHARLPAGERARQRAAIERARLPDDVAVVLFTSGSTAEPRGVVLGRGAIEAAAAASAGHLGWRTGDRWLLALSLAHAGGLAVVVRCLLADREVIDASGRALASALADCSLASLVPTQLAALLDDPSWRPPSGLRAVLLGGAAAPASLLHAAAARGVPFLTTYGMTETLGQVATAPLARAGDPTAPLIPLAGIELTAGVSAYAPAPIAVAGKCLAACYLDGAPIAPRLVTRDLGWLAGDGALAVVGRADDVIVSGGEKIHPSAIEAVLLATHGVRAACAVAVADDRWGQRVGAVVVAGPGFVHDAALAAWRDALPPHGRPRTIVVVDHLPLLPSGKVDRRAAASLIRADD